MKRKGDQEVAQSNKKFKSSINLKRKFEDIHEVEHLVKRIKLMDLVDQVDVECEQFNALKIDDQPVKVDQVLNQVEVEQGKMEPYVDEDALYDYEEEGKFMPKWIY